MSYKVRVLIFMVLSAFNSVAYAGGSVISGGVTEVRYVPQSLTVSAQSQKKKDVDQHGMPRAMVPPSVTPTEYEQAIKKRVLPANLNSSTSQVSPNRTQAKALSVSGDTAVTATGPASIAELARALRNDPDRIYEYVRNNIEYYPVWGVHKGALGTLVDNQGTAFDQAALMVALLRQSGYTASFVKGQITLTGDQLAQWVGSDTTAWCGLLGFLTSGGIPYTEAYANSGGSCPGVSTPLISVKISHVWVKAVIDGNSYYFDPSFKAHTLKAGINLPNITGYNATTYLTQAQSGATINANYIQNLNRTNIRNNLNMYANTLTDYLRAKLPTATLDDVMGGKTIIPYSGNNLRQATLTHQDTSVAVTGWTDIPNNYKPTLRVRYFGIDQTYTSDVIYPKRLTISYNASNQPVLSLDGSAQATGTAVTLGSDTAMDITITHPYASTDYDQSFTVSLRAGGGVIQSGAEIFHATNLSFASCRQ